MAGNSIIIPYKQHSIPAVRERGRILVRVGNILPTLGVPERTVRFILKRDADLFIEGLDIDFIQEMTAGGMQRVRVLTLTGLRILAMRANTPAARELQVHVAGLLRGEVRFREAEQPPLPMLGTHRLTRAETRLIDAIEPVASDPPALLALLDDLRSGARVLEPDPQLAEIAAAFRLSREATSKSAAAMKAVERQAKLAGYTMDHVRQASAALLDEEG